MLNTAPWRIGVVLAVVLAGIVALIPNFFPESTVNSWPSWVPKSRIVLGLDLQGGAYLLYEVDEADFKAQALRTLTSNVRAAMLDGDRIGYTGLGVVGDGVQLRIRDLAQLDEARSRMQELRNPVDSGILNRGSVYEFDLTSTEDGLLRLQFSPEGLDVRKKDIIRRSIEVIGRRINELGTTEPSIQAQGADRILVEAPGAGDPQQLKDVIGKTAQLTFHLVQGEMTAADAAKTTPTLGTIRVPDKDTGNVLELDDRALMTGDDLSNATAGIDQQNGQAVVNFRLTTNGARIFADVTGANVGRRFAIVLDNEVITAPVIRSAIPGGSGQISGNFTIESASTLAILLRAGALPAKLTVVEERSVGPGLGHDSIAAGRTAAIIGTALVGVYMILTYGLFGVFANVALLVNIILVFAIVTILGATLTLPGIAGVVLTVGMAVDSNVLIYERIREEFKNGRRAIPAIDLGFKRALGTILDANITTMIAAVTLFVLGTGPIKGFAVTNMIGIVTTVFTAFVFTRMIVALWVARVRPSAISF